MEDHRVVNIKLDENLSRHLKERLLPLGHNVSTVSEEVLFGKVDVEVGAAAKGENRMVFTEITSALPTLLWFILPLFPHASRLTPHAYS